LESGPGKNIKFLEPTGLQKKSTNRMEIVKTKSNRLGAVDFLAVAIATAGGAGFAPKAPGTAGAAVGVLCFVGMEAAHAGAYYLHVILFLFIVGIWASSRVEHLWGHDAQRIVIDEVVGQMITFGIAAGGSRLPAIDIILGFGLFRLFDITKPFPIRRLERLKGGLGVVADDVGAGLYALAVLMLVRYLHG
jgi:phosphatidylglycerophosphatase A